MTNFKWFKKNLGYIFISLLTLILLVINFSAEKYEYEVCYDNGKCDSINVGLVRPSAKTFEICNDKYICENVPINRLLYKGGTDKKYCNKAHYLSSDYVDNWWNANGLIDECEMPVNADMQFIFKQHDQSIRSHSGTIQVKVNVINYEDNYKAIQIFTGNDNDNNNMPDEWIYCGNIYRIKGKNVKVIHCKGINLKFVKLVNAEWNKGSVFIDLVEVLKI